MNTMKSVRWKTALLALLAAMIWGMAFAFQRMAVGHVEPFTFNFTRGLLAAPCLGLFLWMRRRKTPGPVSGDRKRLLLGAVVCGALLFAASNLQQKGLEGTEAGKAGFITALYIVLVPVFGVLFLRKRVSGRLWISVLAAAAGLYLICIRRGFSLERSDVLVLLCAVVYAAYILAVDHFVGAAAFALETPSWAGIRACLWAILYVGIFSSAVAYTLQFAAQRLGEPVTVTLLLSMESVFSVLGGAILLGETLSLREGIGCAVMLFAVILAQLPDSLFRQSEK